MYVTADALNLRDRPDGVVIGSLPNQSEVFVAETTGDGGWARIHIGDPSRGGAALGWVSASFLAPAIAEAAPPPAAPPPNPPSPARERPAAACDDEVRLPGGAMFCISTSASDFVCAEKPTETGRGLEGCEAALQVSVVTDSWRSSYSVEITCSTTVSYLYRDTFSEQQSAISGSGAIFVSQDAPAGEVIVMLSFLDAPDGRPVISARLDSARCRIDRILES